LDREDETPIYKSLSSFLQYHGKLPKIRPQVCSAGFFCFYEIELEHFMPIKRETLVRQKISSAITK
jgi:hypothetical protein